MAKQTERYNFSASTELVWAALQYAAGQTGWAVAATQKWMIQLNIPPMGSCNAATVSAQVFTSHPGTVVDMTASCFGVGMVMDAPLRSYMRTLQNLIEVQVKSLLLQTHAVLSTQTSSQNGLLDELERLGRLHAQGVLTNEEFTLAKKRLLER